MYVEPWKERVYLSGTDGNQVHPNLKEEQLGDLLIFVSDLSRAGGFEKKNVTQDENIYQGLTLYFIQIQQSLMSNYTYNPANTIYDVRINGTANLATSLMAPVIASKGHFYQMADDLGDTIPPIYDHNENLIVPDPENDDPFLGIEAYSGMTLVARQRIQMNFYVAKGNWFY